MINKNKIGSFLFDFMVLLILILVIVNPSLPFDSHHHLFYLGPVNDILQGKTVMVNTHSQYGVGVLYFLSFIFKFFSSITYQNFGVIITGSVVIQYWIIYFLLHAITKSKRMSVLGTGVILANNVFFCMGYPTIYPSIGPLRFGFIYPYLLSIHLAHKVSSYKKSFSFLSLMVIGISSIWSIESCIYLLLPHLFLMIYEAWKNKPNIRHHFIRDLGRLFLVLIIFQLGLFLFTYLRSGQIPNPFIYLEFISQYGSGFGGLGIKLWTAWILIGGTYLVSLLIILITMLRSEFEKTPSDFYFPIILTGSGIAQFTYFMGRSATDNLCVTCIPAIFLLFYWMVYFCFSKESNAHFSFNLQKSLRTAFFIGLVFSLVKVSPSISKKWDANLFNQLLSQEDITFMLKEPTFSPRSYAIADYLQSVYNDTNSVCLFLEDEFTSEALIIAQKTHFLPIGHLTQDRISIISKKNIVSAIDTLKEGQLISILSQREDLDSFQLKLISRIESRFFLQKVSKSIGIDTYRLVLL